MNRQSAATATAIRPHRRRVLLGLCLAGALLTVVTLVLTWQGRTASRAAVRLAGDDAVLVASVAEVRALLVWVRLDAERATMYPANPEPATRFRTHAAALAEELRRARLHAADPATADVIDDLENRSLAFRESAGLLADALPAAKPEQAAATLAALDQSGAEMQDLADELVTAAGAGLERRAAAAAGTMPWWIDGRGGHRTRRCRCHRRAAVGRGRWRHGRSSSGHRARRLGHRSAGHGAGRPGIYGRRDFRGR
ncbi:MAG: hypothetical protein U0531_09050 [Dehalococcoidia bacterium]